MSRRSSGRAMIRHGAPALTFGDTIRRIGRAELGNVIGVHGELVQPVVDAALARFVEKWPQWGDSFRAGTYIDEQVIERLGAAVEALKASLEVMRERQPELGWAAGLDDVQKRAADVVNQACMAADPQRIARVATVYRIRAADSDEAP